MKHVEEKDWKNSKEWKALTRRSWDPSDWEGNQDNLDFEDQKRCKCPAWFYRAVGSTFEVGYYSPSGVWFCDSYHWCQTEAAVRVHYLNGGKGS